MDDEQIAEMMRDAARWYRVPPEPRLDTMWARIEAEHFGGGRFGRRRWRSWIVPWTVGGIGIAAVLLIGVAIGRHTTPASSGLTGANAGPSGTTAAAPGDLAASGDPLYASATTQHLGRTATLLSTLPWQQGDVPDEAFLTRADELLSTTRLLLDSPAAADPELRTLLGDLELVLAQIARLSTRRSPQEVQLITEALETRDVLPRLHTAVAHLPTPIGL